MSDLEPRGVDDLTGWHPLTCEQSEIVYQRHKDLPTFEIASGYTDTDVVEGTLAYYREWWFNGAPLLRDYRYHDGTHCRHYGAIDATAARRVTP